MTSPFFAEDVDRRLSPDDREADVAFELFIDRFSTVLEASCATSCAGGASKTAGATTEQEAA